MSVLEAIILGIVQGLTEFLPVSSSGHLTIGKELLGIQTDNLAFEVVVHAATVLSTIVAFRKEILSLAAGFFRFRMNDETIYLFKIAVSMIPILIAGLFFKDFIESLFGQGLIIVGVSLLITSLLLTLSGKIRSREKELTYGRAFIIGIAQSFAVLPGLSRSGATISTGLMLGIKREDVAKFSFLMVLVPILGEAILELMSGDFSVQSAGIEAVPLFSGFVAAFLSGLFACKAMIALVKKTKLRGFALYTAVIGAASIAVALLF